MNGSVSKRAESAAIVFALVLPTIVTLGYFVLLVGFPPWVQQGAYGVLKVIQFGFPVVWVFLVTGDKFQFARPSTRGVPIGIAFGLLVAGTMIGLVLFVLEPAGFFDGPRDKIHDKIRDVGLDSLGMYLGASVFYALLHSGMEEYYWRWFVFKRLKLLVSLPLAILISSVGFMAHHVIVLGIYFGWANPATYLFSAAVAVGGAVWAWLYERSGSLYGPWLSHLFVDAAIFTVGFMLARELFV